MIRHSRKEPGFDCFHGNCPDKKCTKPGDHGIGAETWTFAAINDDAALRLSVSTPYFPGSVDKWRTEHAKFRAGLFTLHLGWRFNETKELIAKAEPNECDLLPGGKCWDGGTYGMKAERFWAEHGSPPFFEQTETFWKAMEDELTSLRTEAEQYRHHKVCPYCLGDGFGPFAFPGGAR